MAYKQGYYTYGTRQPVPLVWADYRELEASKGWDATEIHDPIIGWFYDLFCYTGT
jgi:hypothetical protein